MSTKKKKAVKATQETGQEAIRIAVVDVSQATIRRVVIVGAVALLLVTVFPYRHSARASAPISMLAQFYQGKIANAFMLRDEVSTPAGDATVLAKAKGVPVLMYHGVMRRPDSYNIGGDVFEDHMRSLKEAGWNTITMDQFRAFMANDGDLPDRSFLLTFDDGRKDSYYPVDPLLERYGYSATMFVLPQYSIDHVVESPYYLNRDQIQEMYESGRWDIESHTWDGHSYFPTSAQQAGEGTPEGIFLANLLWNQQENRRETVGEFRTRVREDLLLADKSVKALTGKKTTSIAFPFGNYGQTKYNFEQASSIVLEESRLLHDRGFAQVRNGVFRGHGISANHPSSEFLIRRIDVNPRWQGSDLIAVLEASRDQSLPFDQSMDRFIGWVVPSGIARHASDTALGGHIVLESDGTHKDVNAFLDGGLLWSNYDVAIDAVWEAGDAFEIIAFDQADEAPVSCVFARSDIPSESELLAHTFALKQQGNGIVCLLDGQEVGSATGATENIQSVLRSGTVHVRVSTQDVAERSQVRLVHVRVSSSKPWAQ